MAGITAGRHFARDRRQRGVNRAAVKRRAEESLRHELQPGEQVAAGAVVTSDPSR